MAKPTYINKAKPDTTLASKQTMVDQMTSMKSGWRQIDMMRHNTKL